MQIFTVFISQIIIHINIRINFRGNFGNRDARNSTQDTSYNVCLTTSC